jgi:hypothetical protein
MICIYQNRKIFLKRCNLKYYIKKMNLIVLFKQIFEDSREYLS